ncbi:hypothetical protein NLJ89_g8306 [Agrocybe chaxingu]|uniref:DNA damage-binding protein 1 n=1 Tax=Agrocybe chaxingu TaxID=84603 RepID=A0A9W8MQW8_9AGAR|nr:hypothetical protein NLJ89_g8306 [Agrocybe chaxingu]
MSASPRADETQLEKEDARIHEETEGGIDEKLDAVEAPEPDKAAPKPNRPREKKDPQGPLVRQPGKSLLPFATVQRIIKADKEIPIVARDATYLISLATEEFIKRLCEAAQQVSQREKRSTVQQKDIAAVARRADEFLFLEEIILWTSSAKRRNATGTGLKAGRATLVDQFSSSMKVVSTFHPSSSVLSSVKCRLAERNLEHLVVARLNSLDVYSLRPHGLQHECGVDVWGKICSVKTLPISEYDGRSNIVVMITHPEPELIILSYVDSESSAPKLKVKKQIPLFERFPRLAEFFTDFLIHPSGNLAVVSCYAGKLKIITLKGGAYQKDFDVSLPELNVFSLAFLPNTDEDYALGILYLDIQGRLQLCARDIDTDNQEVCPQHSTLLQSTWISEKVVPFPTDSPPQLITVNPDASADDGSDEDAFPGGVLVVGGRQILLYEFASKESQEKQRGKRKRLEAKKKSLDPSESSKAKAKEREREGRRRKPTASIEWPWSEVTAWCNIERDTSRILIGDSFGRLSLLSLSSVNQLGMILVPLGETSSPTTLTYLTNHIVYLGSHLGDSQLLQISQSATSAQDSPLLIIPSEIKTVSPGSLSNVPSKKGKEKALAQDDMDVDDDGAESFKSIAPIMDAALNQIVTCSGGSNTGSVNIVRNGANFKELACVAGLTDVLGIWPVRSMYKDAEDSHLFVSTANESHLFRINDLGSNISFEQIQPSGLATNRPTLAFSNLSKREKMEYVDSSLVVQVLHNGVFLFEWSSTMKTYEEKSHWTPPERPQKPTPEIVAADINASQIALALSGGIVVVLNIESDTTNFRVAINHVTGSEISAVTIHPLNTQKSFSAQLAVAYWTKNVVEIFKIASEGRLQSTDTGKSSQLPAIIRSLMLYNFGADKSPGADYHPYLLAGLGDGSVATMSWKGGALTDRKIISLGATILYYENGRLANSPIMLKEIAALCSLNTTSFPASLALAGPTGLFIGNIKDLNKMHIRSASFGLDNPRRIVHEPSLKAFGVAFTRIEPSRIGNYEASASSFQLLDDNTLAILGQYKCDLDEEIVSLTTFTAAIGDQKKPFFCLGTLIYNAEEKEPSAGRLLIFTVAIASGKQSAMELSLVTTVVVNGCVFALRTVEDKVVAAVNSSILLYRLEVYEEESPAPTFTFKKLAEWNHNYMVTSLSSFADRVVAGDQISSVSLLKVADERLISEARDYGPLYPVAVEALSTKSLICANDTLNITVFELTKNVRGEALEQVGNYHLADMVSKFIRGSFSNIDATRAPLLVPETLYFTSSGQIGMIIDVKDRDFALHLTELQRNLGAALFGVGGISHARYRAPKNTKGISDGDNAAFGFVDGDFLEQYLNVVNHPDQLKCIMKGSTAPEELKLSQDEIMKVLEELQSLH